MDDSPPRNRFQIVSANEVAWESDWNPTPPVAPPKERVTNLPFDWQYLISGAIVWQLARVVPGKVALSTLLHV